VTAEPYDGLTLPPIFITPFITTDLENGVALLELDCATKQNPCNCHTLTTLVPPVEVIRCWTGLKPMF